MKALKISFLVLLPVILFSGCLKVDTKIKINKDGSGTIEEQVLMSDAVVSMMSEFMSSFQDSANTPEVFKLFKEDELKDKAAEYGDGVEYVSGEEVKTNGWQGYKAIYSFDDLNKIKMETDPNRKVEMGINESAEKNEYFNFKFIPGDVSELIIDRPELETDSEEEAYQETETDEDGLDDNFIKMMDGMSIVISLVFNGNIVESNATFVDGSKVTLLDIDFSELLKNKKSLELLKKHPPNNLDEMKEIVKNVPGIKLELQKPVSIKFK
ncbi:MAG: hypothetical protein BMS9Abin39_0613 [Ignavibacteria bacterium]|nr:MAG: hypothetical protein BMS9Abin39_0613 [Ignavibacteria bacterium]